MVINIKKKKLTKTTFIYYLLVRLFTTKMSLRKHCHVLWIYLTGIPSMIRTFPWAPAFLQLTLTIFLPECSWNRNDGCLKDAWATRDSLNSSAVACWVHLLLKRSVFLRSASLKLSWRPWSGLKVIRSMITCPNESLLLKVFLSITWNIIYLSGSSSRETLIDDVYIESKKYIGNWLIVGWKVCDEYI